MSSDVTPSFQGAVETEDDAKILVTLCEDGTLPRVQRKLFDAEKLNIQSGSIYVWAEHESGIRRWTDGHSWSPSRGMGSAFLVYREMARRGSGRSRTTGAVDMRRLRRPESTERSEFRFHLKNLAGCFVNRGEFEDLFKYRNSGAVRPTDEFKRGGLIKKTISLNMPDEKWHVVAYYSLEDALTGRLQTPRQWQQGETNNSESILADLFSWNQFPLTYPLDAGVIDPTELYISDNLCLTQNYESSTICDFMM